MKLTRRDLMILIHGVVLTVETINVQTNGEFERGTDLSKYSEAEDYVEEVFGEYPRLVFQEIDELFNKLVEGTRTIGLDESDVDLAALEPTSKYLH